MFELKPIDGRKSFYGKAIVNEMNGGYSLRSYDTTACFTDGDGKIHKLWDGYSATTMRHINAFLAFVGVDGGGKEWWDALPVWNGGAWWLPKRVKQ